MHHRSISLHKPREGRGAASPSADAEKHASLSGARSVRGEQRQGCREFGRRDRRQVRGGHVIMRGLNRPVKQQRSRQEDLAPHGTVGRAARSSFAARHARHAWRRFQRWRPRRWHPGSRRPDAAHSATVCRNRPPRARGSHCSRRHRSRYRTTAEAGASASARGVPRLGSGRTTRNERALGKTRRRPRRLRRSQPARRRGALRARAAGTRARGGRRAASGGSSWTTPARARARAARGTPPRPPRARRVAPRVSPPALVASPRVPRQRRRTGATETLRGDHYLRASR